MSERKALLQTRPRLSIAEKDHVIEYVGGPHPYYWIGSPTGEFFGAVDASILRRFVNAPLKWQEQEARDE